MFDTFLFLLFIVSVMTSLFVEGVKKFLGEKYTFPSNILAGVVSIVLSIIVGVFYCILAEVLFTPQLVVYLVSLILLSWLCAMIGYDKVIQAITQIKVGGLK